MMSSVKAVVIDHYGGVCKVGLTGEMSPRLTLNPSASESQIDVWRESICTTLGLNPGEYYLLLTDDYNSTTEKQQNLAQLVFEKIKVKGLQFAPRGVLPLYAVGKLTGVVVDSVEKDIYIVPIKDGYAVLDAVERVGPEGADLGKKLNDSVLKCEEGLRPQLLQNIYIAGDNPAHADLQERLKKEFRAAIGWGPKFTITAPAQRESSVWTGGSLLGGVETFEEKWITKEEYEQKGPEIIVDKQITPPLGSRASH